MNCPSCKTKMKIQPAESRDLGDTFGLGSVIVRGMPEIVCPKCGELLVLGKMIDLLGQELRRTMLAQNFPLGAAEIRFLRKSAGLTQQRLGDLLGVDRVTVARWETQEAESVGVPVSIAVRAVVRAITNDPGEAAASASLREPPKPRPSHFEIDAPPAAMAL